MIADWTGPDGSIEYAVAFDRNRGMRLLVVPALFDEGNKLRRLTIEVMRRLDGAGIDCFCPDLPGLNESQSTLVSQTVQNWRDATDAAARHFGATHVLTVRASAALSPDLPGWAYAPIAPSKQLRTMLRSRILSDQEGGTSSTMESLAATARSEGLLLAGYDLSAPLFRGLEEAKITAKLALIDQNMVGGSGLWLRAEPDDDRSQADAIAATIAMGKSL